MVVNCKHFSRTRAGNDMRRLCGWLTGIVYVLSRLLAVFQDKLWVIYSTSGWTGDQFTRGRFLYPFFFNIKFGMVHCWGDCNLGDGLYVLCVSLHVLPCTCVSPPPWFASVYQHGDRACSFTPVSMCVSVPGVSVCGGCFSCGWTGLMVCLHPLKFRGIYSPRVVQRVDPLLR